jgi:hypothetical protein
MKLFFEVMCINVAFIDEAVTRGPAFASNESADLQ